MKDFVEYIIKGILPDTENIIIAEEREGSNITIKINVPQENIGMVIGKRGRIIKSIRALTRAKAIKDGVRLNIVLEDQNPQEL